MSHWLWRGLKVSAENTFSSTAGTRSLPTLAKLAKALNVDVQHLGRKRTMLDGICPEAVDLHKDKTVNP